MLVPGGVLDQPVIWIARNYAGQIWQLLDKVSAEGFDPFAMGALTKDERKLHKKILRVEVDRTNPPDWVEDE